MIVEVSQWVSGAEISIDASRDRWRSPPPRHSAPPTMRILAKLRSMLGQACIGCKLKSSKLISYSAASLAHHPTQRSTAICAICTSTTALCLRALHCALSLGSGVCTGWVGVLGYNGYERCFRGGRCEGTAGNGRIEGR